MLCDCARFRPDDPPELVAASFACMGCLRGNVDVTVHTGGGDADAACACRICGTRWAVALDPMQVVRLSLSPPRRSPASGIALRLRFREIAQ